MKTEKHGDALWFHADDNMQVRFSDLTMRPAKPVPGVHLEMHQHSPTVDVELHCYLGAEQLDDLIDFLVRVRGLGKPPPSV